MEPTDNKIFLSGFSKGRNWKKEIQVLASKIKKEFQGKSCDLAVFFVSETYKDFDAKTFSQLLNEELLCRIMIGCNSSGVIGDEVEIELEPAISVLAMHLPGVRLNTFYISGDEANSVENGTELIKLLDIYPTDKPHFISFADPSSCDISRLLNNFNHAYKGSPVIGGLASGGVMNMPNWLCLNGNIYDNGAVGVALTGNISFETIVSQGCRPIGKPFVITKAEDNVLYELAGKPALVATREVLEGLSAKDKKLSEHSLFVGFVMNENQTAFKRGDFLIRNIMGFDPDSGALIIGSSLKVGQTIQFQLRDAETSEEDLKALLANLHGTDHGSPQGAILVSCCGRGKNLYGRPDHDIRMIQTAKGPLPLAGFFANGEIGPIGDKNYVHGYTSSLVILK